MWSSWKMWEMSPTPVQMSAPSLGHSIGRRWHWRVPLSVPGPSPICIATHHLPSVPRERGPPPGNPAPAVCRDTKQRPGFPSPWVSFGWSRGEGATKTPASLLPALACERSHGPALQKPTSNLSSLSLIRFFPLYVSFLMCSSQIPSQSAIPFMPSGKQYI